VGEPGPVGWSGDGSVQVTAARFQVWLGAGEGMAEATRRE